MKKKQTLAFHSKQKKASFEALRMQCNWREKIITNKRNEGLKEREGPRRA